MFSAFDQILTQENLLFLLKGAMISLGIAGVSLLLGLVLGTIGAACKISKNKILRLIGNVYVEVIRGTPMLLQIMILFTVLPVLISTITGQTFRINYYVIGIIAMSINSGAYTTELIRSGIVGVDKGQWEACSALGLTNLQTMRYIILPQAIKRVIPPLVSEFITLIKDSSLISTIGAVELMTSARVIGNTHYDFMTAYCLAGVYYLVLTLTISFIAKKLERKLAESD